MKPEELKIVVDAGGAGRTLASVLRAHAPISHSLARGIVEAGLVRVRDRVVRDPAHRLNEGDDVLARFDPQTRYRERPRPRGHGFRIVLEDEHIVVVDKEPGVLTVPAPGRRQEALSDRLVHMYAERGVRSPKLWVVHRIDRFTSGLVLFARTPSAAETLVAQWVRRTTGREYLALCEGIPSPAAGRLESRLDEGDATRKVRIAPRGGGGTVAICHYRIEERLQGAALLRVTLETGRRNQIRVQFAGKGHPVIGDHAYGRPSPLIGRTALHAARLAFTHPATGLAVRLESPLPDDMRLALRRLRRSGGKPVNP